MAGNKNRLNSFFTDSFEFYTLLDNEGFPDDEKTDSSLLSVFPFISFLKTGNIGDYFFCEKENGRFMAFIIAEKLFIGKLKNGASLTKLVYMKTEILKEIDI